MDLVADLGHQCYRLSVEWSRIEPAEERFDESAIDHYVDLLERLCARGIKPMVTLHHFTHPQWFQEKGAFDDEANLRYFYRFVEKLVPRIETSVYAWNVWNETNMGDYYGTKKKL